ncbi:hypothetical protein PAXRUDRAFT_179316 [Paxillus rubicundulus Ve08.2h10]|uniref:Uncharacterized protein n=1 Tax=Paxillus rubicundulus Ve08.2h10 TaxID=930991 RepID=A0A0D0CQJ1_9AGAM|nr:hypothetical protein PAXRUDRAFT_179316 [Paxillus rubicundulus Ve08.2h10]
MNNNASPELWSHQSPKQTSSNDSMHKVSVNGQKCAAASHNSVININMDLDHADDEGDNNNKGAFEKIVNCPSLILIVISILAKWLCHSEVTTDEDNKSPANQCIHWQPSTTGSSLESEWDTSRAGTFFSWALVATPAPTTPCDVIDNDGFFNDIHIQSIDDEPKKQCKDRTHDFMAFFGASCSTKGPDRKICHVFNCNLCQYVIKFLVFHYLTPSQQEEHILWACHQC